MITLFTGVPGSGKTASLVDLLRTVVGTRPLYVFGLDELKIPHEKLDPTKWHEQVPDGSIVVIDEVQDVWRPTGPGQKVSLDIQKLETHRHRGIDFFLTTQGPKLVHSNVRDLVGRHVHIRDVGYLGRWWYEWPECSTAISWRTAPIKKKYKLPKAAFDLYKSSSMHIKPIRSFPMMLVVLVGAIVVGIGLAIWTSKSITGKLDPKTSASAAPVSGIAASASAPSGNTQARAPDAKRWPVYEAEPARLDREPYAGRALQYEGGYSSGTVVHAVFGVVVDGIRVTTATLPQLVRMGYSWTELGPCVGVLRFQQVERLVTCAKPQQQTPQAPASPSSQAPA